MTATDERSFLARIAANPADDTDRLVYADWLDEHGTSVKRCLGAWVRSLAYPKETT